jgi:hypothetical protein
MTTVLEHKAFTDDEPFVDAAAQDWEGQAVRVQHHATHNSTHA